MHTAQLGPGAVLTLQSTQENITHVNLSPMSLLSSFNCADCKYTKYTVHVKCDWSPDVEHSGVEQDNIDDIMTSHCTTHYV